MMSERKAEIRRAKVKERRTKKSSKIIASNEKRKTKFDYDDCFDAIQLYAKK